MSEYRKPNFGHLSDREILIIVATEQATIQERLNDHGQRLRFLEGLAKTATGALAIVGVVVGWMKISVRVQ